MSRLVLLLCCHIIFPLAGVSAAEQSDGQIVRMYQMKDLLIPICSFPAPELGVQALDRPSNGHERLRSAPGAVRVDIWDKELGQTDWQAFIKEHFDPAVAAKVLAHAVWNEQSDSMVLTVDKALHRHVKARLNHLRRPRAMTVTFQARQVRMPLTMWEKRYQRLQLPWKQDTSCSHHYANVTHQVAVLLLQQFDNNNGVHTANLPEISCYDKQEANASFLRRRTFIDLNSVGPKGPAMRSDRLNYGTVTTFKPRLIGDNLLHMSLRHERLRFIKMNKRTISLANSKDIVVEDPEISHEKFWYKGLINLAEGLVIWRGLLPKEGEEDQVGLLVVSVRLWEPDLDEDF